MATSSSGEENILWSDTGETIKDIIFKNKLPALVKVSEGYYSDNDAESFSCGDLLKLDFVKTIMKISARVGETLTFNRNGKTNEIGPLEWKDDILIPLGYKGKVQIVITEGCQKEFHSVKELINVYPRFIKTETSICVSGANGSYTIPAGSKLELDRVLPDQGLVCRFEDKEGLMKFEDTGKFVLVQDDTLYTLQEIVDRLSLPQYVRFIETEFQKLMTDNLDEALQNLNHFAGILKLREIVSHQVIVGHHKPAVTYDASSQFCQRSIVLLPLDSPVVNEIEVLTPVCEDTEEYEMVMARNFSQDVDMSVVDGGLYLELARNPKVHRLSNTEEDKPPPVPPRPNLSIKMQAAVPDDYIDMSQKSKIKDGKMNDDIQKYELRAVKKTTGADAENDYYNQDEYDYPDVSKMKLSKSKMPKSILKSWKSRSVKDRPLPLTPFESTRGNVPVGMVTPQTQDITKPNPKSVEFTSLSVQEVVKIFRECKLSNLADICDKEMLDGEFINALTDTDLEKEPFSLNKIQIKKLKRIKEGWRPKI